MQIRLQKIPLEKLACDLLVVNEFEGIKKPGGGTGAVDKALGGVLSAVMDDQHFKAEEGQTLLVPTFGKIPAKKVLIAGLGQREKFDVDGVRKAAAVVIKHAKALKAKVVGTILHGAGRGGIAPEVAGRSLAEGALLAEYEFARYKTDRKNFHAIETLIVAQRGAANLKKIQKGIADGSREALATIFARDLVNEPASAMTPKHLVGVAQKIVKGSKRIKLMIHNKVQLTQMSAGGILGIARGSVESPYLIHLRYIPAGKPKKKIALVGKAVTFDSGGISIKPAEAMYTMKNDMAAAAALLGLFSVISELGLSIEVHGIMGAVENMPGPGAIKPGDVVRTMGGKTIEVLHTDAEGRVTLADTLHYACKLKPDLVVDLATLTGSAVAALGEEIAAIMSTDKKLIASLVRAAGEAGEKLWELPLEPLYAKDIKSDVADVRNITKSRYAGAITAGLFLKEFVDPQIPWAHIDIAGPAFAEAERIPYVPKGGTGFGTRTLIHFLSSL